MAPRGIVATVISSMFALRLEEQGHETTGVLVSMTFFTIVATVVLYGLSAPLVTRKLGTTESNPQGLLFVGAEPWCRQLALLSQRQGFRVLVVDSNRNHTSQARMPGVPTYAGNILAEQTLPCYSQLAAIPQQP